MKKYLIIGASLFLLVGLSTYIYRFTQRNFSVLGSPMEVSNAGKKEIDEVEKFLEDRRTVSLENDKTEDIFDKNGLVHILLIGLDRRVGQPKGHCDVIQMITIDKNKNVVSITALPRGTYAPLPPGVAATSTDYYVSNACGLVSLEYGITQMEKILGQKADYIVVVGFSETLGILRNLNLPTTETLQWLRQRHIYAIGEPQRAHNHSTFLKALMTKYIPQEKSSLDVPFEYIMYKMVQTDLSFAKARSLVDTLSSFDLASHPDKITLSMRPAYLVSDIAYDPQHLNIAPGVDTIESIQKKLLDSIDQKKKDPEFVKWGFENDVWLQVEDAQKREALHFEFLQMYLKNIEQKEKRQELIGDYILEMEHREQIQWEEKGKELLKQELFAQ